jgi:hypothetical protein
MITLEDAGYEVIKRPIKRVRVQFHGGLWYVEYQRPPQYVIDGWWWFDDSKHPEYKDAFVRAQELAAEGGVKEIKHKTLVFEVES